MNFQQVKSEALSTVDAALAILNKFPDLNNVNQGMSLGISTNPFPFLLELFKTTAGYKWLIEIVSYFLVFELPFLEIGIKGIILSNLRNLLTCSINPFITNDLLRNGVAFNLEQLDLTDLLHHSPLDSVTYSDNGLEDWKPTRKNMGRYYYFGCEGMEIADDVKYSIDMNALLWYMKVRSTQREVWGRPDPTYNRLYEEGQEREKHKKEDGIVTMEFHERTSTMRAADGGSTTIQSPMNNCLQVFIGNTQNIQEKDSASKGLILQGEAKKLDDLIKKLRSIISAATTRIEKDAETMKNLKKECKTNETYKEMYESLEEAILMWQDHFTIDKHSDYYPKSYEVPDIDELSGYIDKLQSAGTDLLAADNAFNVTSDFIDNIQGKISNIEDVENSEEDEDIIYYNATWIYANLQFLRNKNINQLKSYYYGNNIEFPELWQNYYYKRTIIEFDFDYVMSVQLFDARVLAAQLIDQLVGSFSFDLQLTAKEYFIKGQIQEMVNRIVQSDDVVVDDCFFAFSNDEYSKLLDRAEKQYAGLSVASNTNSPRSFDATEILASLDSQNIDAQQAGSMQTAIEGALTQITGFANTMGESVSGTSMGFQSNIKNGKDLLNQLLDNLAFVIVSAVLSPKVYMLILFNLKVLGQNTSFNLEGFINQYTQLIVNLIRQVRDEIISFLVKKLQEILVEIAKQVAVKISVEQAKYYADLIKRCIACFKSLNSTTDWTMDNVMHADIENSEIEGESERTC